MSISLQKRVIKDLKTDAIKRLKTLVSDVKGRDHVCGSNFIMTESEDIESSGATAADQDFIVYTQQDIQSYCKKLNA